MDQEAFTRLMSELRPRLHRYCARMVGSAVDGEDVVQDALIKATETFPASDPIERPESWLFRIAHNVALDALRRRRKNAPVDPEADIIDLADPDAAADARVAVAANLATFMRLPASQRSSAILVDVLGYSLEETANILGVTLIAAKAALNRARTRLRILSHAEDCSSPPLLDPGERNRLRAYADRFNAREFDALRDLLAEDVRLDLYNRRRLDSRAEVARYFTHYSENPACRVATCLADGRLALAINDPNAEPENYIVILDWDGDHIARIRDFRYAPYVMEAIAITALP
jgi:RNA polymerase sigma-70 factor (ECF subfamily)